MDSGSYLWTNCGNAFFMHLDLGFYSNTLNLPQGLHYIDETNLRTGEGSDDFGGSLSLSKQL